MAPRSDCFLCPEREKSLYLENAEALEDITVAYILGALEEAGDMEFLQDETDQNMPEFIEEASVVSTESSASNGVSNADTTCTIGKTETSNEDSSEVVNVPVTTTAEQGYDSDEVVHDSVTTNTEQGNDLGQDIHIPVTASAEQGNYMLEKDLQQDDK